MRRDRSVPENWRRGACQERKAPCARNELVGGKFPLGGGAPNPWWDPNGEGLCIWAAYQPRWAANLAASYLDLSGNGNNATDPGGAATPAWDAVNGWKFDGVGNYLSTAFLPQKDQTQTVLIQYTNWGATTGDDSCFGVVAVGPTYYRLMNRVGIRRIYGNSGQVVIAGARPAAGNVGFAGAQGYQDGLADGGAMGLGPNDSVWGCAIGAQRTAVATWAEFSLIYIQALAIYDCTLTAPQVLAVATAMAAL